MAKFYVNTNEGRKYIKEIDYAQGTLTFTSDPSEAYTDRDGYYASPTKDMISRGFREAYPEVENLHYTSSY